MNELLNWEHWHLIITSIIGYVVLSRYSIIYNQINKLAKKEDTRLAVTLLAHALCAGLYVLFVWAACHLMPWVGSVVLGVWLS